MSIVQLGLLSAISTPFALAAWMAVLRRPRTPPGQDPTLDGTAECAPGRVEFEERETLDVEPMVRAAAKASHNLARANFVRIELAVSPGMKTRVGPIALRNALRATVQTAISSTRGGHVLITGMTVGGQLRINVMDDGGDTNQKSRETLALNAAALIAPQGGSIAVQTRPGVGTTVTLRLPPPCIASTEVADLNHTHEWAEQVA